MCAAVDGAARGNPGPAGAGVWLGDGQGRTLGEHSVYLGATTNNVAEYAALLVALHEAARLGATDVRVQTDSELLAKQIQGEYRVKDPTLRALHAIAQQMQRGFARCRVTHIPREQNRVADRLANRAVDAGLRAHTGAGRRPNPPADPTQGTFLFPDS